VWYNKIMIGFLRSPFHGMVSGNMMLIIMRGRKSGRTITLPVNYLREGDLIWIFSLRTRTWWRNLRGSARVKLHLKGQDVEGNSEVYEDKENIQKGLQAIIMLMPIMARYLKITLDSKGQPEAGALQKATQENVVIRVQLDQPG
jgi:hypothetical protein